MSLFLGEYRKQNKTTSRILAILGMRSLRVHETGGVFVTYDATWPGDDKSLLPRKRLQESQRVELERRLEEEFDVVETSDVRVEFVQNRADRIERSRRPLLNWHLKHALCQLEAEVGDGPLTFVGGIAQD